MKVRVTFADNQEQDYTFTKPAPTVLDLKAEISRNSPYENSTNAIRVFRTGGVKTKSQDALTDGAKYFAKLMLATHPKHGSYLARIAANEHIPSNNNSEETSLIEFAKLERERVRLSLYRFFNIIMKYPLSVSTKVPKIDHSMALRFILNCLPDDKILHNEDEAVVAIQTMNATIEEQFKKFYKLLGWNDIYKTIAEFLHDFPGFEKVISNKPPM